MARSSASNASESSIGTGTSASSGSGEVDRYLSAEEREVWLGLGQALPVRVPFSKAEERILKRVRRKIKNKVCYTLPSVASSLLCYLCTWGRWSILTLLLLSLFLRCSHSDRHKRAAASARNTWTSSKKCTYGSSALFYSIAFARCLLYLAVMLLHSNLKNVF